MKQNIYIAWRNFRKNSLFSLLNILGLSIGFAGFILCYQYINREISYDTWNPNYDDIYLVGLSYQGEITDQTPPSLASTLMEELPEIKIAGRIMPYPHGTYPVFGKETALVQKAVMVDSAAAQIFQVRTTDGTLFSQLDAKEGTIANRQISELLFSKDSIPSVSSPIELKALTLQMDFWETFYGVAEERRPSILDFDMLLVKNIYDEEQSGNPYTFQTYIQVASGTNIGQLTDKINQLYQHRTAKHELVKSSPFAKGEIYLDPLQNLHLKPKHGSSTRYTTVWVLGGLSVLILILSAINFTNLMIAQSDHRSKEVGIKKLFGIPRSRLVLQFIGEVFLQCFVAALMAWVMLSLSGNVLQKWFNDDISNYLYATATLLQLSAAVVMTTCIAGIYPALVLSGYRPMSMLRGSLQTSHMRMGFRTALLTFQFIIASLFISGIIIVNSQLDFMRSAERGFETEQVITFKGMQLLYAPSNEWKFDFMNRLKETGTITHVASTTNSPAEPQMPVKRNLSVNNRNVEVDHIGVDLDYFELLSIDVLEGRAVLSQAEFEKDTVNHFAVINERALQALQFVDPIGKTVRGCNVDLTIIGVVRDVKSYGFEKSVAPSVYTFKDECGPGRYKLDLLIKTAQGKTHEAIAAVEAEWEKNPNAERLPLDYVFMDSRYAALYASQEQLSNASRAFACIALAIATLGLFNLAAYNISRRRKEISIRKVLGASLTQVFIHLNQPFVRIFVLANLVAIPLSYLLMQKWLQHFAYQIEISAWPFVIAAVGIFLVMSIILVVQSISAARANPVDSLRDE